MKRFILTLVAIATLNACSKKDEITTSTSKTLTKVEVAAKLTGKWALTGAESVTDLGTFSATVAEIEKDTTANFPSSDTMTFKADGKYVSTAKEETGNWSLSNDGSSVTLVSDSVDGFPSSTNTQKLFFTDNNQVKFEIGAMGAKVEKEGLLDTFVRSILTTALNIKGTKDQKEKYKSIRGLTVYKKL